jgi:prepilin-type N-terminal cleavage/methylation domain-containing protein
MGSVRAVRSGWTLPEMLIALTVTAMIVALAAGAGVSQLRIYRGLGDAAAVRTQVAQAALVAAGLLRDVPSRRHILVAMDSAIEVAATTGTSFTCRADTGRITVARPEASGFTLAAFTETPQAGDAIEILAMDSTLGRLDARVADAPTTASCPRFAGAEGWSVPLVEPFVVQAGMPVRFTRRHRLSTYRGSDGLWYLGMKEWNPALARFNTIQPVAGPLLPQTGTTHGLTIEYRDASGSALPAPALGDIAIVTVTARGLSSRPVRVAGMRTSSGGLLPDSATISIAIR